MFDLVTAYNKETDNAPVQISEEDKSVMISVMQTAVNDVNLRFNNACQELTVALMSSNMSEAMEQVGVALRATYDNTRIMIDMFNHIAAETGDNFMRRHDEQEGHLGTSTEGT